MRFQREEKRMVEAEDGNLMLLFHMQLEKTERGTNAYSVLVKNECTGECAWISDITENRKEAEELFCRLIQGAVTPTTLRDVVEDFVAERTSGN